MPSPIDFKVIALKPLRGCNPEALKILKPGTTYYLYNNYKIDRNSIHETPGIEKDFFSEANLSVNISAIVGKNGAGKSSLIELLIQAINNISYYSEIHSDLSLIPRLKLELYFNSDAYYKIVLRGTIAIYKQPLGRKGFQRIQGTRDFLRNFFYSVIVNYSHYGLNSREVGFWINGLFHKNDGYQTPIVINPMRTDGNVDINTEHALANSRFMANLLRPANIGSDSRLKITENLTAKVFKLTLKEPKRREVLYEHEVKRIENRTNRRIRKIENSLSRNEKGKTKETITQSVYYSDLKVNQSNILNRVNEIYNFGYKGKAETNSPIINLAHRYIIRKLVKIATTYPFYNTFFDKGEKNFVLSEFDTFISLLFNKNENHIAFKLKQTLNFLKYRHVPTPRNRTININISDLTKNVQRIIKKEEWGSESTIQLLPPPIFQTDILMKPALTNRLVRFDNLSSGEKQLIYSVNSILYHLINLDSIGPTNLQHGYKFVNIVLEEIELYFHPDRQREFISFLLQRIKDLTFKRILGLNITVVTHSPFILSDIPNSNILFLNNYGKPKLEAIKEKTFGANIHDLLKNNFFLEHGYMGQFAKEKIKSALAYLEACLKKPKTKNTLNQDGWTREKIREFIEIIGEPLIRNSLNELYLQVFILSSDDEIDREIARLQKRKRHSNPIK